MSTPTQPPKKRSRKVSILSAANTPSKQALAASRVSHLEHPHPLRQTSFPRDFSSDDRNEGDRSEEGYFGTFTGPGAENGQNDDEVVEDEDFDVTRQAIRRGDNDDDDDDEDDDGGLFNFSSVALNADNSKRSIIGSKRPQDADVYDKEDGGRGTAENSAEDVDVFGQLFPDAAEFGVDIDDVELSNMAAELPDNLHDVENLVSINRGANQTQKRRRIFGPGMSQEQIKLLISSFTDDQMERYETFRRANISRGGVKKLANAVLNQSIANNVAVAISGFSKVFLGEVIERALDVQRRMDPPYSLNPYASPKPLLPEHIREAWRLYKQETALVPAAHWRRAGGQGDGRMFR
ncbi:hTAFII28-like protein conserved region-domain-containing protein [Lipomyces orientalis]|uniref:HTAFII28-like protein conserved region-domain-containing protein n=1 Tax=Lipomyces orientalis TaxID=1233043 RepID=A0ACC3TNX3_9ASCO